MVSDDVVRDMTKDERDKVVRLALGRLFRLGSRPTRPGDAEEYERCRLLILAAAPAVADARPNYARDRHHGALGD